MYTYCVSGENVIEAPLPPKVGLPRKRPARTSLKALKWLLLCVFLLLALLPLLARLMFLDMPAQSETFDCDDATLFMLDRFSRLGITATPIVGDLTTTGEKYHDINHIWLLVDIAGLSIPFDWGTVWIDGQHYEGYTVSYPQLLAFVEQDRVERSIPAK